MLKCFPIAARVAIVASIAIVSKNPHFSLKWTGFQELKRPKSTFKNQKNLSSATEPLDIFQFCFYKSNSTNTTCLYDGFGDPGHE